MLLYLFLLLSLLGAVLLAPTVGWLAILYGILLFLALLLVFCLVFLLSSFFVDLEKPQEKRSGFYHFMSMQFMGIAFPLLGVKVKAKGLELVPKNEPFLLVSNHISDFDPIYFLYTMPFAKLGFISKKENYQLFFVNKAMHRLHCLPIDRENDRAAVRCILKTIEILRTSGHSMAVFPEGYESKDGKLLPFRNGVFKISQRAGVPIVVAVLRNADQVTKNLFRRSTTVEVEILGVVPHSAQQGKTTAEIGEPIHKMMLSALEKGEQA